MPSQKQPLNDFQVHDRLVAAVDALGSEPGQTTRGNTALEAARRALAILQMGLVGAMERNSDEVEGVIKPRP